MDVEYEYDVFTENVEPVRLAKFKPFITLIHQELHKLIKDNSLDPKREQGGILYKGDNYEKDNNDIVYKILENKSSTPLSKFKADMNAIFELIRDDKVLLYIHSHPQGENVQPSIQDLKQAFYCNVDWCILSSDDNNACYIECNYYDNNNLSRMVKNGYHFTTF